MQGQLHVHAHGGHALGMQAQIVEHIENAFKNNGGNKWEAWWKAVLPHLLAEHKEGAESPDEEDAEWDDFWEEKKNIEIKDPKERLNDEDPSVDVLMRDALGRYQGIYDSYPNWQ